MWSWLQPARWSAVWSGSGPKSETFKWKCRDFAWFCLKKQHMRQKRGFFSPASVRIVGLFMFITPICEESPRWCSSPFWPRGVAVLPQLRWMSRSNLCDWARCWVCVKKKSFGVTCGVTWRPCTLCHIQGIIPEEKPRWCFSVQQVSLIERQGSRWKSWD